MADFHVRLVALHSSFSHSSPALYAIYRSLQKNTQANVEIIENLVNTPFADLMNILLDEKTQLVAFSCYLWNIDLVLRAAQLMKKILSSCRIVLGGPQMSGLGRTYLAEHSFLDFVIDGEGEQAFSQLVYSLMGEEIKLSTIRGLCYRTAQANLAMAAFPPNKSQSSYTKEEENIICNSPMRLLAHEIESILPLCFNDMPRLVYWETSRGCPFTCTFCASGQERMVYRHFEILKEELFSLENYAKQQQQVLIVKMLDRSFSTAKNRLQLLDLFLQTSWLRFHLEANPDYLDEEILQKLEKFSHEKLQFEIGIQSLDEKVLSAVRRKMNIKKSLLYLKNLIDLKFDVHIDLIAGLPLQTLSSFEQDLNILFFLFADHLQLGTLKILPGTQILQYQKQLQADNFAPHEVFMSDWMSVQDLTLVRAYAKLIDRLYNSHLLSYSLYYLSLEKHPTKQTEFPQTNIVFILQLLVDFEDGSLYQKMWKPQQLFKKVSLFFLQKFPQDQNLKELLVWDYLHNFLPNQEAPAFIQDAVQERKKLALPNLEKLKNIVCNKELLPLFEKRKFAIFYFSVPSVEIIKQRDLQITKAGLYFCLRRSGDKKGSPIMLAV